MADDGNIPSTFEIIHANDIIKNYYTQTEFDKEINERIKYLPLIPIGGKIFYDAGNNGATYIFYDSSGNIISDTSIDGLQNAVSYRVGGIPSKDRFYAVYPNVLNNKKDIYWGFYCNADIKSEGGNIVNTGTDIGTGKTNTTSILNYISTYAPNETARSESWPRTINYEISQSSPDGHNLYKNCGASYNYLWDAIKGVNKYSLGGHNDWFIPSKDELYQIGASGVIYNITDRNHIWSSSAYPTSYFAWIWSYGDEGMKNGIRDDYLRCLVCRAF